MARDIYVCTNCGHPQLRHREDDRPCFSCEAHTTKVVRIPYNSGYDEPKIVLGWARAHNLERVAGAPSLVQLFHEVCDERDANNVEMLRDLLAVTVARLEELTVDEHAYLNCPYCSGPLGPKMRPVEGGDPWRTCRECGNNVYNLEEPK